MHDPWQDRLSEYIDGGLDPAEMLALEQHVGACDECAATLAELRQVIDLAGSVEDDAPASDLWPAIAAGLGPRAGAAHNDSTAQDVIHAATRDAATRDAAGSGVIAFRSRGDAAARSAALPRRFSFSAPQLAAAAMLLMALGGGAVWLLAGARTDTTPGVMPVATETDDGVIMRNSSAPEPVRLAAAPSQSNERWDADVAELKRAYELSRERLDPATIEILERSMDSIDRAIADAQAALDADPGNPHLHRQLDSTRQKKLEVLRRASRTPPVST
ncbi:hypothetical protein BH23GEM9_BH23GEM9_31420 [soil metagenome]